MQTIPLFNIPLYTSKVQLDDTDLDVVTKLTRYERLRSNNGSISADKQILESEQYSGIRHKIQTAVDDYVYNVLSVDKKIKFEFTSSWCVLHQLNDQASEHYHSNALLSGILYFQVDKDSGSIVFKKGDYTNLFHSSTNVPFDSFNIFNSSIWTIQPEAGDILIFPSHLKHQVTESKSTNDRYCLAFNLFARGELSNGLGDQDISRLVL
jgi:uncharacterized protein (TIGR02466 family)